MQCIVGHRCLSDAVWSLLRRGSSSGVSAAAGSSAAPDVCLHVAGAAAEERDALWEAGGVCVCGD